MHHAGDLGDDVGVAFGRRARRCAAGRRGEDLLDEFDRQIAVRLFAEERGARLGRRAQHPGDAVEILGRLRGQGLRFRGKGLLARIGEPHRGGLLANGRERLQLGGRVAFDLDDIDAAVLGAHGIAFLADFALEDLPGEIRIGGDLRLGAVGRQAALVHRGHMDQAHAGLLGGIGKFGAVAAGFGIGVGNVLCFRGSELGLEGFDDVVFHIGEAQSSCRA